MFSTLIFKYFEGEKNSSLLEINFNFSFNFRRAIGKPYPQLPVTDQQNGASYQSANLRSSVPQHKGQRTQIEVTRFHPRNLQDR